MNVKKNRFSIVDNFSFKIILQEIDIEALILKTWQPGMALEFSDYAQ